MKKRLFFSGQKSCNNGCKYCFLQWSYPISFTTMPYALQSSREEIVYPVCDSELNQQEDDIFARIESLLVNNHKCIVSISTKDEWSEEALDQLDTIRQRVGALRIKLSVSITCKSLVKEIEPGASDYDARIRLLSRLAKHGILHSVLLKPLLPFVSYDEYCEIVNDVSVACKDVVIGDLDVDQTTDFFNKYILGRYKVNKRFSAWLQRNVDYIIHPQKQEIVRYIRFSNLNCYLSDADFLVEKSRKSTL